MPDKKTKIKICGIKDLNTAKLVQAEGADFIGFVHFQKSPRHIELSDYQEIAQNLTNIQIVVVTVDPSDELIADLISHHKPDFLQIHGQVSIERINAIKAKFDINIIVALAYDDINQEKLVELENLSDYLLIDSASQKQGKEYGGTGHVFDWQGLSKFNFNKPYFLSGGLNINNIKEALDLTNCQYFDLSSGVESEKGVKSHDKIRDLLSYIKAHDEI
jgi:phosphoribosylanthranilate isomerase